MPGVVVEEFPGLDLRADPGSAACAIDALNVTIEPGRVRSRDGSVSHLVFTPAAKPVFLMPFGTGMIVGTIGSPLSTLYAVDQNGGNIASVAVNTGTGTIAGMSGASLGTTATTYAFIANGGPVQRWDGAVWSWRNGFATFPAFGYILSISPQDNRLVVIDAATSTAKVWFSNEGDPNTYGANNYVILDPGDNENYVGAAVYNNQTFVFKQSKFFVFYGTTSDSVGNPVFNHRSVRTPVKIPGVGPSPQSICASPNGVYFIASDGIYRTTGGTPSKISAPLDPFFTGDSTHVSPYWQGGTWTPETNGNRLCWSEGKLYASLETSTTTSTLFVLDEQTGAWTAWGFTQVPAMCATVQSTSTPGSTVSLYLSDGPNIRILRMRPASTDDGGLPIVSRYRQSFETFGQPGEKTLRETIIEGIGSPIVQWSRDWGSLVTGSTVTLGTSPAIGVGRQRLAIRGRALSVSFRVASGKWSVNRYQANVRPDIRPPGVTV